MNQHLIKKLQTALPNFPIEKAWLFGSYARGEENRKSDVDILVRFLKDADISLLDYVKIMLNLQKFLHRKVDLVEDGQLYSWAQESADNDKILIYERNN